MFELVVMNASSYAGNEAPEVERSYYDLFDARTVAEVELRNLMNEYDDAVFTFSTPSLYVVESEHFGVRHIYITNDGHKWWD